MNDTRCTYPTVQRGAHHFGALNARRMLAFEVAGQRRAGNAALLRAVVHQAVLADVEVPRARAVGNNGCSGPGIINADANPGRPGMSRHCAARSSSTLDRTMPFTSNYGREWDVICGVMFK